jgi:hypothetical protein
LDKQERERERERGEQRGGARPRKGRRGEKEKNPPRCPRLPEVHVAHDDATDTTPSTLALPLSLLPRALQPAGVRSLEGAVLEAPAAETILERRGEALHLTHVGEVNPRVELKKVSSTALGLRTPFPSAALCAAFAGGTARHGRASRSQETIERSR